MLFASPGREVLFAGTTRVGSSRARVVPATWPSSVASHLRRRRRRVTSAATNTVATVTTITTTHRATDHAALATATDHATRRRLHR